MSPNTTPFEEWFGFPPTLSHLKVFGCTAYALIHEERRHKLESHTTECLFLGYSEESKAYRLIAKSTKQIIISHDVIFDEHSLNTHHSNLDDHNKDAEDDNPNGLLTNIFKLATASLPPPTRPYQNNLNIGIPNPVGVFIDPSNQQSTISQGNSYEDTSSLSNDLNHTILEEYPRLSVHGEDLNSNHETPSSNQSRPTLTAHQQSHLRQNLRSQREIRKPTRLIETIEGRKTPQALIHHSRIIIEPTTYKEAIHGPGAHHWKETIQLELNSLKKNDTWISVPLLSD